MVCEFKGWGNTESVSAKDYLTCKETSEGGCKFVVIAPHVQDFCLPFTLNEQSDYSAGHSQVTVVKGADLKVALKHGDAWVVWTCSAFGLASCAGHCYLCSNPNSFQIAPSIVMSRYPPRRLQNSKIQNGPRMLSFLIVIWSGLTRRCLSSLTYDEIYRNDHRQDVEISLKNGVVVRVELFKTLTLQARDVIPGGHSSDRTALLTAY